MALSHYCCRTTLQCQCHETVLKLSIDRVRQPKQYSLEFAAEGEQGRHVPDMTRQRIPGSCCSRRKYIKNQFNQIISNSARLMAGFQPRQKLLRVMWNLTLLVYQRWRDVIVQWKIMCNIERFVPNAGSVLLLHRPHRPHRLHHPNRPPRPRRILR